MGIKQLGKLGDSLELFVGENSTGEHKLEIRSANGFEKAFESRDAGSDRMRGRSG
jgi:hypothetical protein